MVTAVPSKAQEVSASAPTDVPAQTQSASADDRPTTADVVVTGTRVSRNGYDAPTPTTVVGAAQLEAKAPATIIDALVTLPAFKNNSSASTAGVGNSGTAGQSFANLRGLGANRTLVLLDGQRFVPSTSIATVDLGVLPTALVQRVDVVTGGASAAYGSDAVAGVVNFVLDNRFVGIKADIEEGLSTYGDDGTLKATLAAGVGFGDGRGHLVLDAEYLSTSGVRPHARPDTSYPAATLVSNPAWTATNGQLRRLILPYVYYSSATYGGVITSGPLAGTEFGPGGTTFPQPTGTYKGTVNYVLPGLANEPWQNTLAFSALPLKQLNGYGRLSWDVTSGLTAYVTGVLAHNEPGPFYSSPANTIVTGAFNIRADNPYIPATVGAQLTRLGLSTISVGRYSEDWGNSVVSRTNDTQRGVIGLQGSLGGDWKLDVYGEYGHNRDLFVIQRNVIKSNLLLAADAVTNANGQIVCRSTLTSPNNGCVPLNIFGQNSASSSALNYIFGTSRAVLDLTQKVAAANISGEPFSTWAGKVSLAVGGEYRSENAVQTVDALSQAGAFAIGNPKALSGGFDVKEVFGETVVPLAKNVRFLQNLDVNAAVRYTDYSTSGSVVTWKIGGNWEPFNGLRFRATRSRDIRAPNILELFTAPVQQTAFLIDPVTNTQPSVQTFSIGNPNLKPEKADTLSFGMVARPEFLRGVELSVDYYRIKIQDAIATLALQDVVNRCYAGNTALCSLITRTNGVITQLNNPYLNLQSLSTDGIDFEASYRRAIGPGRVGLRVLANRTLSYVVNDGVTAIDRAGDMTNAQPKWTGDATIDYELGHFNASADVNYIGPGKYDVTFVLPTDINNNDIPSKTYVDFQLSYDLGSAGRRRQFFVNVSNAFNVRPPAIFLFSGGPNYDRVGRTFRFGLRFAL